MATLPAQRLKMGSTQYYLASMKARELVSLFRTAAEIWDDDPTLTIEDRIQRDINVRRLRDEVMPYLAHHEDRFFGSVIVLMMGSQVMFESLSDVAAEVAYAYREPASRIGFLTVSGGTLIALDGQHRLVALREILHGGYGKDFDPSLADDDLSVILIEFENIVKTRRIFNKVNRYARATSRADNLILSEDDGYAIIARRLFTVDGAPLRALSGPGDGLVNWKNNTISARSLQITTISALSIITRDICESHGIMLDEKLSGGVRADDAEIATGYELCAAWIETAFRSIDVLNRCRRNPSYLPAERTTTSRHALLLKPAGQITLFRAACQAREAMGQSFDLEDFMTQAGRLDWSLSSPAWNNVLVLAGKRVLAKQQNYDDAALIVVWMVFGRRADLPSSTRSQIEDRWNTLQASDVERSLPLPEPL